MRRRDRFGEGVHALEALAVVRHHFAGAPQIIQSQRAVLAAAITLRSGPRRHLEVAVAHGAALAQDRPHFDDGIGVVTGRCSHPVRPQSRSRRMTTRQCGSSSIGRTASQPPQSKELALPIGQLFPHARRVIEHAAVQRDVLAARDDLQRVELQVLHRAHGLLGALEAAPAPPGPQALLAEDEAAGDLERDLDRHGAAYGRRLLVTTPAGDVPGQSPRPGTGARRASKPSLRASPTVSGATRFQVKAVAIASQTGPSSQ